MATIYILEDDPEIRTLETYALKNSGFEVEGFDSASALYAALQHRVPSLLLLDIMLPGEDGLSVLTKLRAIPATADLPIILVTAKSTELDTVRGFDLGADDYLSKPFGVMELVSRVKARLRKTSAPAPTLVCGGIKLSDDQHQVTVNGAVCDLTYKEYALLHLLLTSPGKVFTRNAIMEHVWGYEYEGYSRTLDMHIKTLRQKLGTEGHRIVTVRNVGFKLANDGEA